MPSSSKASIATVQAAEPDLPNPLEEESKEETKQPVAPVEDLKEDDEEIESRYSDGNKEDEAEEPVASTEVETAVEEKDDDQAATGETGTTDINSENLANPSD